VLSDSGVAGMRRQGAKQRCRSDVMDRGSFPAKLGPPLTKVIEMQNCLHRISKGRNCRHLSFQWKECLRLAS